MAANSLYAKALANAKREQKNGPEKPVDSGLMGAMDRTFGTNDGMRVLQFICRDLCGYHDEILCLDTSAEIAPQATAYNLARRSVYRELRALIRNDILKQVEFGIEPKETPKEG